MAEAWLERWQEGRIGWHEDEGNASLKRHWRGSGRSVLVPLCMVLFRFLHARAFVRRVRTEPRYLRNFQRLTAAVLILVFGLVAVHDYMGWEWAGTHGMDSYLRRCSPWFPSPASSVGHSCCAAACITKQQFENQGETRLRAQEPGPERNVFSPISLAGGAS